ncbi:iron-sulfur cluster biosynthesis family protein [Paenibacillus dendritiformis]|uniref:iron-sulfur cluster biosynthesis family protein n=1 Tax=Paenibacillus TaxID=44249 RepID=UPI00105AA325|nr:iron-sulfur cluster biosynthesis family protein [Paenibacillus dendritiformis]TDL53991.1 iron-sulfur cluster biosynthesis family protein [Paenibacillus dendritiformis]WGU95573.1 iron-sulfur cluster biosynthesis family protein [Paenibacillus dendritiformis]
MSVSIEVTPGAEEALRRKLDGPSGEAGYIKLIYDTDGCGCAVNGVPALWLVRERGSCDEELPNNASLPMLIDRHQTVFYEERMKLDSGAIAGSFVLSSPQQIYSTHVICSDRRTASEASLEEE